MATRKPTRKTQSKTRGKTPRPSAVPGQGKTSSGARENDVEAGAKGASKESACAGAASGGETTGGSNEDLRWLGARTARDSSS